MFTSRSVLLLVHLAKPVDIQPVQDNPWRARTSKAKNVYLSLIMNL